ncbi:MAG: hypothetical protein AB1806_21125 [Acidobacteriota bacterium]
MGLFDTVVCRYPLPHHQDAEFQSKDLPGLALGDWGLGGFMDEYEIAEDGRLRRHVHEREWTEDASSPLAGYLRSTRDWWEDVPDVHGDVVIYTRGSERGQPGFLEMAARYAGRFQVPPRLLPSGWAALLELYGLR